MNKSQLKASAEAKIDEYLKCLENTEYASFAQAPYPTVSLDQRGAIAGCAQLQKRHIKLQAKLYQNNPEYFEYQVIPHELAHLIVYAFFGRTKPHGKEWQHVMQDIFQRKADVRHSLDLAQAGIKRFVYHCNCGEVELSTVRHNKVQRGKKEYKCQSCLQTLRYKYVGEETAVF